MRYVGPVAAAFNISIEEVTGTLSILYNAGFEASQAGTALRGMLADLSNAASPANDKLKSLGITFEMVNPALASTTDGVTRLQEIIRNLSPIADNGGKIMEIFGDRAGPAMIKLLQAGEGEIKKYTDLVTGTNAATNAAAIQNDTLQFSMKRLGNAAQAAGNAIIKEFAPGMKDASNFVADLLFKVGELPAPLKILIGVLLTGAAAIAAVNGAAALLGITIGAAIWPITAVIGGIAALTAGAMILTNTLDQTKANTANLQKTQGQLKDNTDTLKQSMDEYKKANNELNDKTKALNDTERQTLETRKKLSGLEIVANLDKTIKSFDKLEKEYGKQSNAIENLMSKNNEYIEIGKKLADGLEEYTDMQDKGIKTYKDYRGELRTVAGTIESYNKQIDDNNKHLQKNQTALTSAQYALESSNESRRDYINLLALAVSNGSVYLAQINLFSEAIGKEVEIRMQQIANEKLVVDMAQKLAAGTITATDLNKLANKELIKKIITMADQIKLQQLVNTVTGTGNELTSEEIDANKELQKTIQKTKEQLQDLNATDLQKIEIDRNRAKAEVDLLQATEKLKTDAKASIDAYYDALKKKTEAEIADKEAMENADALIERHNEKLKLSEEKTTALKTALLAYVEEKKKQKAVDEQAIEKADEYIDKLQRLTNVNYDLIGAEEQRAIEEIKASGASDEAMQAAIKAVQEYYAALRNKTAFDEFKANMKKLTEDALSGLSSIAGALADLTEVRAQKEIDTINQIAQAQKDAIDAQIEAEYGKNDELLTAQQELLDAQLQAALEAAGVAEETQEERLLREIEEAKAKGDIELANEKEKELLRYQITKEYEYKKKALEDQAIIDKQAAEDAKKAIDEQAAKDSAQIAYKAAHAAWVLNNLSIITNGILAVMQAWSSPPGFPWNIPNIAGATIGTGILLAKQAITEPQPPAMQSGGIVMGSQMRGTPVITAENGSNELLLNDSNQGQQMMNNFARSIANQMGNSGSINVTVILQQDSKETARAVANVMNNGVVTLKQRAIE
jgi:hypothetical protein